ncbi:hypothetical protein ACJIZ3_024864 [Penstemon smallii]|uniref:CTLH domain-containing protein n=1 Tax=Penstemon smallii TaxID=265156 RepID=A0ABD3TWD0_9LAMI
MGWKDQDKMTEVNHRKFPRNRIFDFALNGNTSKAIELTEELAPGLLEENKDLHFDLLSLHFAELVCSRKIEEALGLAQIKFAPFGKEQKYVGKLEDGHQAFSVKDFLES